MQAFNPRHELYLFIIFSLFAVVFVKKISLNAKINKQTKIQQ